MKDLKELFPEKRDYQAFLRDSLDIKEQNSQADNIQKLEKAYISRDHIENRINTEKILSLN